MSWPISPVDQRLFDAAKRGDRQGISDAIRDGARRFSEALEYAASNGDIETMRCLKPRLRFDDLDGAVEMAALSERIPALLELRDWGARDFNGALREAAASDREDIVWLMVAWGATDYAGAISSMIGRRDCEFDAALCDELVARSPPLTSEERHELIHTAVVRGELEPLHWVLSCKGGLEFITHRGEWGDVWALARLNNHRQILDLLHGASQSEELQRNLSDVIRHFYQHLGEKVKGARKPREHKKLVNAALALAPLSIPAYEELWLLRRVVWGVLSDAYRLRVIERVNTRYKHSCEIKT